MLLKFILERCGTIPRNMVFDFACGTLKTAIRYVPKLAWYTQMAIDAFHFPGHKTCSYGMHPLALEGLEKCNTESQEQRNSLLRGLQTNIRMLSLNNFQYIVAVAHGMWNIRAMFRERRRAGIVSASNENWMLWARQHFDMQ